MDYIIYTDSAADMPHEAYSKYNIKVISMDYMLNGKSITFHTEAENHDQLCDELFEAQKSGADVHTSQITPFHYVEQWEPEVKQGNQILYLAFSSGMSATYQNAVQAAQMLKEDYPDSVIRVVDSKAATAGQGVLVYTAALNKEKGMSLEENAQWLEEHVPYLCHRFVVGDLDYLHKGGRVSKTVAIVGGMLNIKPSIIIKDDGQLEVVGKTRGTIKAMKSLVENYKSEMGVPDVPKVVYISHSSMYETAEKLKKMVLEVAEEGTQVEIINQSPIIGVHTGPEFFSVCGWGFHRKIVKG